MTRLADGERETRPRGVAAPALYRVARRTERVELGADYPGAWVEVVLNPGIATLDVLRAEWGRRVEEARRIAAEEPVGDAGWPAPAFLGAMAAIVRAWNLADADGTALPATEEGLRALDWMLVYALQDAWVRARALPKSSAPPSSNGSAAKAAPSPAGSSSRSTPAG